MTILSLIIVWDKRGHVNSVHKNLTLDYDHINLMRKLASTIKFDFCVLRYSMAPNLPNSEIGRIFQLIKDPILPNEMLVFIDEDEEYVKAMQAIGIKAIHYKDAEYCREELIKLGIIAERITMRNWISNLGKAVIWWTSNNITKFLPNVEESRELNGHLEPNIQITIETPPSQGNSFETEEITR